MALDPKQLPVLAFIALDPDDRGKAAIAAQEGRDDLTSRVLEAMDRVVPELEHAGLVLRVPLAILHYSALPFGSVVVRDPGPSGIAIVTITQKGREILSLDN